MRALNRHIERVFNPSRKGTHWGNRKPRRITQRLAEPQIFRGRLSLVWDFVVADLGPLRERGETSLLHRRDMDEHVLSAAVRRDKPVTLGRVEPLHRTHRHVALHRQKTMRQGDRKRRKEQAVGAGSFRMWNSIPA